MAKVEVQYFGVFRNFGVNCVIEMPDDSSIKNLKEALIVRLGEAQRVLVEDSVIANDTDILTDSALMTEGAVLSILPPVCGG